MTGPPFDDYGLAVAIELRNREAGGHLDRAEAAVPDVALALDVALGVRERQRRAGQHPVTAPRLEHPGRPSAQA
jgi:hypothetical protein